RQAGAGLPAAILDPIQERIAHLHVEGLDLKPGVALHSKHPMSETAPSPSERPQQYQTPQDIAQPLPDYRCTTALVKPPMYNLRRYGRVRHRHLPLRLPSSARTGAHLRWTGTPMGLGARRDEETVRFAGSWPSGHSGKKGNRSLGVRWWSG